MSFFLSITLPKHISSGKHTTCVRVGACVGVHHHSVHCPLHRVLIYILWSCKNLKGNKNILKYYMRIDGNCVKLAKKEMKMMQCLHYG